MENEKNCARCKQLNNYSRFPKYKKTKYGLSGYCKEPSHNVYISINENNL